MDVLRVEKVVWLLVACGLVVPRCLEALPVIEEVSVRWQDRVEKHVTFLARQKCAIDGCLQHVSGAFCSQCVQCCASDLNNGGDLSMLADHWADNGWRILTDEHAIREFGLLLFSVYAVLLEHAHDHYMNMSVYVPFVRLQAPQPVHGDFIWLSRLAVEDIVLLCAKLDTIPLARLFSLLDEILERYQKLMAEETAEGAKLSWRDWVGEYWWVPLTSICVAVWTYLRWKYNPQLHKPVSHKNVYVYEMRSEQHIMVG